LGGWNYFIGWYWESERGDPTAFGVIIVDGSVTGKSVEILRRRDVDRLDRGIGDWLSESSFDTVSLQGHLDVEIKVDLNRD
jgi:hypothetical protein